MTTVDNFRDRYRMLSDMELLRILENASAYQPAAIDAANTELSTRQLSAESITAMRQLLKSEQQQKENTTAIEEKVRVVGKTLLDTINPLKHEIDSPERTIRLIIIIFGLLTLYTFIGGAGIIAAQIGSFTSAPFASTFFFGPQTTGCASALPVLEKENLRMDIDGHFYQLPGSCCAVGVDVCHYLEAVWVRWFGTFLSTRLP